MYQSPKTLEEICLDAIADNIDVYVKPLPGTDRCCRSRFDERGETKQARYVFRDPDIFLIQQISEKLMCKLLDRDLLGDTTFHIFSEHNTKLGSVKVADCRVSEFGLKVLRDHKITDLECINLSYTRSVANIIDCLSDWSHLNLMSANFTRCNLQDNCTSKIIILRNLRSLNLSYTRLSQESFAKICTNLQHLEKLDICGTKVKNLAPLSSLSRQLRSFGAADLPNLTNIVSAIIEIKNLQHLDLSIINEKLDSDKMDEEEYEIIELLEHYKAVPNLKSLEISGWKNYISKTVLTCFLEIHPDLQYLGIVMSDLMFDASFSDLNHSEYPSHLVIGGLGNKEQIKVTLQKYKDRSTYIRKALYHLFQITNGAFPETCPNMFDLVLPVMAAHYSKFDVQMAATACMYNLTKGDLSKHIHPNLLSRGINLTLDAMAHFPKEFQLQKNSLLTLCNDRILQEVNFNRFRCAKLVLDALCAFSENNISRMAVAICSILAAKISTAETSKLGSRPIYMKKLLDMVENRVDNVISDVTLKFTLSALWNLTDESPTTCDVFLDLQGAHLFLNVLKTFKDDGTIETKVLGLLNNIAEVATLRPYLMLDALVNELFYLLKSENIDVSYFAAGIVAHLASDGEGKWTAILHTRDEMLIGLEEAIKQWLVPQSEMVAYRSFRPFFPLLMVRMDYRVQLWALWAIHHVCSKNPQRYCTMLREENGDELLVKLLNYRNCHEKIKKICSQILDTLEQNSA